jgi:glycerophosphoryl diester phosphodiesterase
MLAAAIGVMFWGVSVAATPIEVQGHRGARAARPENTLPAFEYAIEVGADVLELDVCVTKDDRLVIGHDPILSPEICLAPDGKKIDREIKVAELTLAELRQYDCGTLQHPRFAAQRAVPGAKMPSLEELIAFLASSKLPRAKTIGLNIELKSVPGRSDLGPPPERWAALIVPILQKAKLGSRTTIQSFDHRTLRAIKKLDPKQRIAALISDNFLDFVAVAKSIGAEVVSPDQLWITAEAVEELHRAGIRVVPWTANDPPSWKRLIEMKVDGIITDDPAGLLEFLGRKR